MPKVKNLTDKTVPIQHWKLLPDGRALDPRGNVKAVLPDDVAYSAAAKRLADQGVLDIEGYVVKKTAPPPSPAAVLPTVPPVAMPTAKKKKDKDD